MRGWLVRALATLVLSVSAQAQVTTRDDTVGRLLNEWFLKGRAAGLVGITYENRDGGHSQLKSALYPQLQVFRPDEKSGSAIGPAETPRPTPTVGNCSMAAPAISGGSLPRFYQMDPKGTQFLMGQYLSSQLFIYPEHKDYDIGANGVGGYGDLYPINNATTLISQGSSGSDQPFLNALLCTLAALPPQTRDRLIEKRILMPALQSILRKSNKMVVTDEDYFTGAAHPPVFAAAQLDEEKMVHAAQQMTPALIPPMVQVRALEETEISPGRHYFEAAMPARHKFADTPVSIARVVRGNGPVYEMTVTTAKTADLMDRPLQLRWQLLQGDPNLVKIVPTEGGVKARLELRGHPPIIAASGIRSHRVDIGVFASNGISVSTPAFLSFYFLPNEKHFYDAAGRLTEIYYQAHNPDLGLPTNPGDARWLKLMLALSVKGDGLRSRLAGRLLTEGERQAIQSVWLRLKEKQVGEAEIAAALAAPLPSGRHPTLRETLEKTLAAIVEFADLYPSFQTELDALAARSPKTTAPSEVRAEVLRLIDLGVLIEQASGSVVPVAPPDKFTAAERDYLSGLNLTLLSQVLFPEVLERSTAPAWVDPRLTTPKPWRDIFRYDEKTGELAGWLRHGGGRVAAFDAAGRFLPQGFKQPEAAQEVIYEKNAAGLLVWRAK